MTCWDIKSRPPGQVDTFIEELNISKVLAWVLLGRGIGDIESARAFLSPALAHLPDPRTMVGMKRAVHRMADALKKGEVIAVFGDYDADGTTATALAVHFLRRVGGKVIYNVANRAKGYGLHLDEIDNFAEQGTKVLLTVDCGTNETEAVAHARNLEIDVLICDHHTFSGESAEPYALINPHQENDSLLPPYPAAVGVVFLFLVSLRALLRDRGLFTMETQPVMREYLDLVALGTIADMVPLTGLNRILAAVGLGEIAISNRVGLEALKDCLKLRGRSVNTRDVAFRLGPCINAAGRMGDALHAVNMLLADDWAEAEHLARGLIDMNNRRRKIEQAVTGEASKKIEQSPSLRDAAAMVASGHDWSRGVIGIVASRLLNKYHRPVAVISVEDDLGTGSVRGTEGFNVAEALEGCRELLVRGGGHAGAGGFTLEMSQLEAFKERFVSFATECFAEGLEKHIEIDAEIEKADIGCELVDEVERLAPFGEGNREPIFLVRRLSIIDSRVIGQSHLKLMAEPWCDWEIIGFNLAEGGKVIAPGLYDLVFNLRRSTWKGAARPELVMVDNPKIPENINEA